MSRRLLLRSQPTSVAKTYMLDYLVKSLLMKMQAACVCMMELLLVEKKHFVQIFLILVAAVYLIANIQRYVAGAFISDIVIKNVGVKRNASNILLKLFYQVKL